MCNIVLNFLIICGFVHYCSNISSVCYCHTRTKNDKRFASYYSDKLVETNFDSCMIKIAGLEYSRMYIHCSW